MIKTQTSKFYAILMSLSTFYSMYSCHEFDRLISSLSAPESWFNVEYPIEIPRHNLWEFVEQVAKNSLFKFANFWRRSLQESRRVEKKDSFGRLLQGRELIDQTSRARASPAIIDIYEICQFTISAIISMTVICTNVLVTGKQRFRITVTGEWNTLVFPHIVPRYRITNETRLVINDIRSHSNSLNKEFQLQTYLCRCGWRISRYYSPVVRLHELNYIL